MNIKNNKKICTFYTIINKLLLIICLISCFNKIPDAVKYIENNGVKIGILPEAGGRIVLLTYHDCKNLILSNSKLWNYKEKPSPFLKGKAYLGHIVWVGPQAEWWTQQTINKKRLNNKALWPPDPWLEYGKFNIINQKNDYIKLLGPESPISGLQLAKEISIDKKGIVHINVTAKNIRQTDIKWDLWFNTRVPVDTTCYVPLGKNSKINVETINKTKYGFVPYDTSMGFFSFKRDKNIINKYKKDSKAFIYPEKPFMVGFNNKYAVTFRFELYDSKSICPGQSLVEIYIATNKNPKNELLELECHSPYKLIKPGQTIKMWQTWEVIPYNGKISRKAQIDFINDKIMK